MLTTLLLALVVVRSRKFAPCDSPGTTPRLARNASMSARLNSTGAHLSSSLIPQTGSTPQREGADRSEHGLPLLALLLAARGASFKTAKAFGLTTPRRCLVINIIPPMLAMRLEDPRRLADPRYSAEPKLDGQRAQLHVREHRAVQ